MQKQQVFKVKGMQRDASMANANGEFAYEILNMRLMPAEDLSGFSLTNEKGATQVIPRIQGQVIGQCPTNDSLVVFTTNATYNENDERTGGLDYIYEVYQTPEDSWTIDLLYEGDLNFHVDKHIEALFNYETEDIQKVYWIDGLNQLRCINLVGEIKQNNDQQFDSVKEINSLPSVDIERVIGGSFTAGVIQYYVTYFNKNSSESPIVYTSPLLYIAHDNRGANVNDQVPTAFKLTFTDLDTTNWEYMRIYATHRTSIDATPEASIITELNTNNSTIEFTDYGSNRTSIAPTDLYFTGGKFVKAGTMTVKDQVMFLGHLNIETPETVSVVEIQNLFDSIRDNEEHPFTTTTRKTKENKLEEYEDTHYYYKNQLNNTESITHYKYGEKYRFGISVLDKYGNWSNPIWIKDAFIEVPPEQVDSNTLELPCPSLNLSYSLMYDGETKTLLEHLQDRGAISIKPLVVFPKEEERKVIAQGIVCPTVYNLKDRKENGPYAQASWFMRPNSPADLWGFSATYLGKDLVTMGTPIAKLEGSDEEKLSKNLFHKSDIFEFSGNTLTSSIGQKLAGYYGVGDDTYSYLLDSYISPEELVYDDGSAHRDMTIQSDSPRNYGRKQSYSQKDKDFFSLPKIISTSNVLLDSIKSTIQHGAWVEFRHNYAIRTPGWSFGVITPRKPWNSLIEDAIDWGMVRGAELDTSSFNYTAPVNRFDSDSSQEGIKLGDRTSDHINTGNSAYYIDNSIITVNSPEIELSEHLYNHSFQDTQFRIIGMIPLTATSSDMSLEVDSPAENPDSADVGLKKVTISNLNIGIHGFKGLVSSNAYYSHSFAGLDSFNLYGAITLFPWHSTGSLGRYVQTRPEAGTKSLLKRKILSNLRYSASTYYFNLDHLTFEDTNNSDQAELANNNSKIIGWKPSNGSYVSVFNNTTDTGITKLFTLNYPNFDSLIYKGNIDSLALATANSGGTILDSPIWGFGTNSTTNYAADVVLYDPAMHVTTVTKSGKGASIKYKSSPHFIVGFKPYQGLWGTPKTVQETLPTWRYLNEEGLLSNWESYNHEDANVYKRVYESEEISSLYHQNYIQIRDFNNFAGLPNGVATLSTFVYPDIKMPGYGWLWLGEIYRETDPTFGGTTSYSLENNAWVNAGNIDIESVYYFHPDYERSENVTMYIEGEASVASSITYANKILTFSCKYPTYGNYDIFLILEKDIKYLSKCILTLQTGESKRLNSLYFRYQYSPAGRPTTITKEGIGQILIKTGNSNGNIILEIYIQDHPTIAMLKFPTTVLPGTLDLAVQWSQGDTYYQRFDTLKTYAYSDSDQNSVVDITSFMVETRINIDGRTDRNRGQESNLQMSPTNFNLMNDVYSQRDNFFTYRILDEDLQARTNFPNQITWSLTKTAGATVDAWMNITLASVLDLDGTKGELTALKNFNNNIIAFQEKGLSNIMFNSRAQIATSEAVPIQIANTGKVDGQQYFTTNVGCQDKWNIVTTPNGLYFVDYFNKSIYRFNGQLEDISTPNGFRSWCYENLNSTANILGYYDVKNKEVMYYIGDTSFELSQHYLDGETLKPIEPQWLGFSELTGAFSSFYTYPKAWFANVQDQGLWLLSGDSTNVYTHQTGEYNQLLNTSESFYGLTVIPRQDSNTVKTFNNVEFRADSYNNDILDDNHHFDTISAETEYQPRTTDTLTYSQYRPSNLKKKFRTWRANIPRVNNGYNRFVNQWAKIGLWKMNPGLEKTILHDLSVWYSE